jgi:MerR family transcriptional regulator, heat shock protein HspR
MTDDNHKEGSPPASDRGVYGISVAAELSGIKEQSLRLYEREGLLTPARSRGGTRRYSADDLARLARIRELVDAGVNLTGIERILGLEDRNTALDDRNVALEDENAALEDRNVALEGENAALEDRNVALEGDNAALRTARRKSARRPAASPSPDTDSDQSKPSN